VEEEAAKLISDEDLPNEADFEEAWQKSFGDLAFFPERKIFGRLSTASKQERLSATAHQFEQLAAMLEKDAKKVRDHGLVVHLLVACLGWRNGVLGVATACCSSISSDIHWRFLFNINQSIKMCVMCPFSHCEVLQVINTVWLTVWQVSKLEQRVTLITGGYQKRATALLESIQQTFDEVRRLCIATSSLLGAVRRGS
jgi:hypothetical protein